MGAITPYEFLSKQGQPILLRTATPNDAKAVIRLSREVMSENNTLITTIEEFNVSEQQQREFIHLYVNDPSNCMIVAEYNRSIIGLLTFQCGTFKKYSHHGTIGMIVSQNWRGMGIGKALLSTIINWAEFHPFLEKLCLEVLASNKNAIVLYERLGFIEEGRQVSQVKLSSNHYDDIILMGRFLSKHKKSRL